MNTTPENVKFDYIGEAEDEFDALLNKVDKILENKMKCTLELNFDGNKFTCKLTKLSVEDTDKVLR